MTPRQWGLDLVDLTWCGITDKSGIQRNING